ncbi:zinc ABC transporter substrate-binding protein [Sulfitobacter sp.]|uniref:zinc ABC transporter substrate-binding protein n=1 Tax=Sulfitobacter sp. TaxID=1903071 RepID=UPI000C0D6557|nr:zinc transporter [Roseobacter sp.]MBV47714.1 zinc transporter [Roseobacter sp.]PHR09731.1 MAG: zinc transporter [Sulfitobacter sp.]|tara:strand:- start:3255 stop:4241 length:987 start_codon:yes stop_codon:yes gene_type:complete
MRAWLFSIFLISGTAAQADVPRVATDIAPVHSLVAMVMEGVGTPDLIIPSGATPHSYAMRPSEARALAQADMVIWIGPALTPWLADPIKSLAPNAQSIELMAVAGTQLLANRTGVAFEADKHDAVATGGAADQTVPSAQAEAETAPAHADGDVHAAGGFDPHVWLDPENAKLWLGTIANALSARDQENAATYAANAAQGATQLDELQTRLEAQLAPLQGRPFIVFHDAYHYFEARFGVEARAAISLSDGVAPSAARMAEVKNVVGQSGATCVFTEPQFNPGIITALQTQATLTTASIDPLGARLPQGPELYPALIESVGTAFTACLTQ